ncbi:MAG: hypothetical protein RMJ56_02940 [Gemmataceae bacterium]|nr:hypothetical protein [Gemmata sp.]MDW8196543.1 hypothetical protein [Gemmataceae bacterium]
MNPRPPHRPNPDPLDRLLSDFFKAQMKQPWPQAPLPPATVPLIPSELATPPTIDARSRPVRSPADATARARFTLAASVALALGAAWLFTNHYEASHTATAPPQVGISDYLQRGTASGENHPLLKEIPKTHNKAEVPPPKITIDDL